ncbi:hypothetical protein Bbelb_416170 [Branchiostoma belcheri]|nr:hypothetical protein Bbelb_416170 [Branchiostoma belcheri]
MGIGDCGTSDCGTSDCDTSDCDGGTKDSGTSDSGTSDCGTSDSAYERATYGLGESNFTILTCNCCTDSARSTSVPRTVLASSVLTPHFPVDLLNDHAEHTCTILVYKDDLTGDCQLVSKMPRKAQKKSTRQDPKKRAAEDTRAASDDEVNRRCTHLQRASTTCTRQRGNRTEIVRCKHVQLTYHLRNVRCTQPLTVRRVVQTTYVHLASDVLPRPATLRLQKKRSRRSHDKNVRTKSTHGEL